jgi:prepilin-type N-terminal cleavage/methylation domain-containing protein
MISLKKENRGFTIVELLIVIVVIGILAGLVITTYNGIQQKARNTERQTDLKALQGQLEAYTAENGRYPSTADLGSTSASNVTFIQANMKGLDKEALRDPKAAAGNYALASSPTVNQYSYAPTNDAGTACDDTGSNDCTKYTLTAKQEGGGADIVYTSLN